MPLDTKRHPCFNATVKGQYGRIHLPVAPQCNIRCNYCNRKYDCVNESRPGVTSTVLAPEQAVEYLDRVLAKEPRITVAGIAGPGDPFANPEETMSTLRLVRRRFPGMMLCLASNGMAIAPHIEELASLGVTHVTITVNAVRPEIGARIYAWVRDNKVVRRGEQGAALLLERQLAAIRSLKEHGVTVKINYIVIPGINDSHVAEVARTMRDLGVDLFNCMALFPNQDTPFAGIPQPDKATMSSLRAVAEEYLPQMRHCTRCRADAVGLLDADRTEEFRGCLSACASLPPPAPADRPFVAVATMEGVLINQHLGEARSLQIWEEAPEGGYRLASERPTPPPGGGLRRWLQLASTLRDCRALLVSGIGPNPAQVLQKAGVIPYETEGFIDEGLAAVYQGGDPSRLRRRRRACSGGGGCL